MAHLLTRFATLSSAVALLVATPALASAPYDRAAAALAKGDPRTARVELLNAIKANPDDGAAHLLQSRVYIELGEGVAAEAEVRRARETGIAEAETHHLLARALLLQNKPQDAIAEAEKAPPAFAGDTDRAIGRALAVLGKPAEAAVKFEQAAARLPNDPDAWSDLGRLRLVQGDIKGATVAATRALSLSPKDVDALVLRGDLARGEGEPETALGWYDRALATDAENLVAMVGKAGALSDAGRMRDMLALTRQVLKRDPKNGIAFHLQARLAAAAGNYELARVLLQKARDALENYPAAILLSGIIEYRTGNEEQAIERLSRLVALQPGHVKARRVLAAAQWRAGSADAAAATLQPLADGPDADRFVLTLLATVAERNGDTTTASAYRARAARPNPRQLIEDVVQADRALGAGKWGQVVRRYESLKQQTGGKDAAILNNLAWAYAEAGKTEQALATAAEAHRMAPKNASVLDTYGWLLHRHGKDAAKALEMMRSAAAAAPANPTVRWHLAQAYARGGQAADAKREVAAALAIPGFAQRKEADALLKRL